MVEDNTHVDELAAVLLELHQLAEQQRALQQRIVVLQQRVKALRGVCLGVARPGQLLPAGGVQESFGLERPRTNSDD